LFNSTIARLEEMEKDLVVEFVGFVALGWWIWVLRKIFL
jgi:hypothetical protein